MSDPPKDDAPLNPAAARMVARMRLLMLASGVTTFIAIAAVLGVIGYRVFRTEGSVPLAQVTATLPKGARVVAITASGDLIVVTIEVAGVLEARTFDARTLQPAGSLRFATEP
jgi:hypothetical protein